MTRVFVWGAVALLAVGAVGSSVLATACTSATCANFANCEAAGDGGSEAAADGHADVGGEAAACTAQVADTDKGVFVSLSGSDAMGCGSESSPCRTIATGLAAATGSKSILYVAEGVYVEAVSLSALATGGSSFAVAGGWSDQGGMWSPVCGDPSFVAAQTTIQGTVTGSGYAGTVTFSSLTIAGAPGSVTVSAPTVIFLHDVATAGIGDAGGGG
jgi:hypothetical protein